MDLFSCNKLLSLIDSKYEIVLPKKLLPANMTNVKIKTMYDQASKIGEGETSKHTNCCSTSLTKSTVKGLTVLWASERQKVDDIFYENHFGACLVIF